MTQQNAHSAGKCPVMHGSMTTNDRTEKELVAEVAQPRHFASTRL